MSTTCDNCGLPSDRISTPGRKLILQLRPENSFHREHKRTVWVCSDECAWQAMAIAKYGPNTRTWLITLAQFRAMNPLPCFERSECYETIAETRINSGSKEANFTVRLLPHYEGSVVTPEGNCTRKGGRPRKHKSNAARQRAYRAALQEVQASQ